MIYIDDLEFGSNINIVTSPNPDVLRINNNALCWQILSLGFNVGRNHNISDIEVNIPEEYKQSYEKGRSIK